MAQPSTNWDRMTMQQKLTAAAIDVMYHKEFTLLSGILMMGRAELTPDIPTACTDGLNCMYGTEFMATQNRAQWRWIVLHENFHKALHHCVDYGDLMERFGMLCNIAQDFVINAMIDEIDPTQEFAKQPAGIQICLDKKYYGMSFIEVLRDLLKNAKISTDGTGIQIKGMSGSGAGQGEGVTSFDEHKQSPLAKQATEADKKELQKVKQQIQDALHQGKMTVQRMAGAGKGSASLDQLTAVRVTDWKTPLREFIETICAGHDNSRFNPPNKRFMPLGILMPSHFSESTGEIHVYCDTSGSMAGVYPVVFGEIARIAAHARPELLRVIWWDGAVQAEQVFKETDYDQIATLMKPAGGGGTTPSCVVDYVKEKGYKPKAGIWLTDGYLGGETAIMPFPVIWGVVDNEAFLAPQGKKINIQSAL